jgi:hypothetical protein
VRRYTWLVEEAEPEVSRMCMSCGCGNVDDDRGDPANITREDLERAAAAADTTPKQAAENLRSCC